MSSEQLWSTENLSSVWFVGCHVLQILTLKLTLLYFLSFFREFQRGVYFQQVSHSRIGKNPILLGGIHHKLFFMLVILRFHFRIRSCQVLHNNNFNSFLLIVNFLFSKRNHGCVCGNPVLLTTEDFGNATKIQGRIDRRR